MKQQVDDVITGGRLFAELVVEQHRIEEQWPVISVVRWVKYTTVKRSSKIGEVFIVLLKVADKDRIVEFGKSKTGAACI